MSFSVTSSAFGHGQHIPPKYTGDGTNTSPQLKWVGAPGTVKSFAVIMEDPDAPNTTFHHWAVYNIPVNVTELPEGFGNKKNPYSSAINDFGRNGYDGPLPPRGHGKHRYFFKVFALDVKTVSAPAGAKVLDILKLIEPHVIGKTEVMGVYERLKG